MNEVMNESVAVFIYLVLLNGVGWSRKHRMPSTGMGLRAFLLRTRHAGAAAGRRCCDG